MERRAQVSTYKECYQGSEYLYDKIAKTCLAIASLSSFAWKLSGVALNLVPKSQAQERWINRVLCRLKSKIFFSTEAVTSLGYN